jgi:hypothetical protein
VIRDVPADATYRYSQKYDTENIYDGGALEYRLNGGLWTDAEPFLKRGHYLSGISGDVASEMRGRAAWSGDSDGWQDVEMDLTNFAGEDVEFRWVFVTDGSGGDVGWWVDDAIIEYLTFACTVGCASSAECPDADVNCDNVADGFDIAVIRNSANWLRATEGADEPRADVNGDGVIDGFDIAVIRNSACWLR